MICEKGEKVKLKFVLRKMKNLEIRILVLSVKGEHSYEMYRKKYE